LFSENVYQKVGRYVYCRLLDKYYARDFVGAKKLFAETFTRWLPGDPMCAEFVERCTAFQESPPPVGWVGMELTYEK